MKKQHISFVDCWIKIVSVDFYLKRWEEIPAELVGYIVFSRQLSQLRGVWRWKMGVQDARYQDTGFHYSSFCSAISEAGAHLCLKALLLATNNDISLISSIHLQLAKAFFSVKIQNVFWR